MVRTLDEMLKIAFTSETKTVLRNIMNVGGDLIAVHTPKCDYLNVIEGIGALGINYIDFLRTKDATFENIDAISFWTFNFYIPETIDSLVTNCGCKKECLEKKIDEIIEKTSQFIKKLRKRGATFSEIKEAMRVWTDDKRKLAKDLIDECGCKTELEEEKVRKRKRAR
jgi:hypothetical protein